MCYHMTVLGGLPLTALTTPWHQLANISAATTVAKLFLTSAVSKCLDVMVFLELMSNSKVFTAFA